MKYNCVVLFLSQLYLLLIYAPKYFLIDHHCKGQTEFSDLLAKGKIYWCSHRIRQKLFAQKCFSNQVIGDLGHLKSNMNFVRNTNISTVHCGDYPGYTMISVHKISRIDVLNVLILTFRQYGWSSRYSSAPVAVSSSWVEDRTVYWLLKLHAREIDISELIFKSCSHWTSALTLLNRSRNHLNFNTSVDADADAWCELKPIYFFRASKLASSRESTLTLGVNRPLIDWYIYICISSN